MVVLGLAVPLVVCCATLGPSYEIVIENSTGVECQDTHVYWQGFKSVGGVMIPRATVHDNFIQSPLPPRVMVRWRTPDGVTHQEEVEIPEGLPRRFQGTLHFEILEDGRVEVRVDS